MTGQQQPTATPQTYSHQPPVGFIELFIGYENGKPAVAHVFGVDNTMGECKENGQKIIGSLLASPDAPDGAAGTVACIPIPPASQVTQVPQRSQTKPTEDQKETSL